MNQYRILHLSDLHLKDTASNDQKIVTDALMTFLRSRVEEGLRPDLVIFSGDLVNAGASNTPFRQAIDKFIRPMLQSVGVSADKFIVCPGNHDIDRNHVRTENWEEEGLMSALRSRDDINQFIDRHIASSFKGNSLPGPFKRLAPFYNVIWREYARPNDLTSPFLLSRKIDVDSASIGICAFNTAWRCTGEPENADRGHLILGERVVDRAAEFVKGCDLRIAVLHHPLDWLRDEDRAAVEPRLHEGFDLVLFGHVHRTSPEVRTNAFGGLVYSQAGCLYETREYFDGFSEIVIDFESDQATVSIFEYDDRSRRFSPASSLVQDGQLTFRMDRSNGSSFPLRTVVARMTPIIRKLGNDHISLTASSDETLDIERNFVAPPLSPNSAAAQYIGSEQKDDDLRDLPSLVADAENLLIAGDHESGKTTIAHHIALLARGYRIRSKRDRRPSLRIESHDDCTRVFPHRVGR